MMSPSDSSTGAKSAESGSDNSGNKNINYGRLLAGARKAKNYSVDEVSEYLKIPARTIIALESNDNTALPAPTFTQGYIRAYAKFLEISEESVLAIYQRAVPHDDVSELKRHTSLPNEANSQSPLIKTITIALLVAGMAAIGFGSFQYYQKKAGDLEDELETKQQSFTGNSLDSPGANRLEIKQNARLTDDDELIVDAPDDFEGMAEGDAAEEDIIIKAGAAESRKEESRADEAEMPAANRKPAIRETAGREENTVAKVSETTEDTAADNAARSRFADAIENSATDTSADSRNKNDILEIFAENGAWVEVHDAKQSRLLYNMVPAGGSKVLAGRAPFRISMGNARTTRVVINDLEIDMAAYIRSNNTAIFKVSTQGKNIVFH